MARGKRISFLVFSVLTSALGHLSFAGDEPLDPIIEKKRAQLAQQISTHEFYVDSLNRIAGDLYQSDRLAYDRNIDVIAGKIRKRSDALSQALSDLGALKWIQKNQIRNLTKLDAAINKMNGGTKADGISARHAGHELLGLFMTGVAVAGKDGRATSDGLRYLAQSSPEESAPDPRQVEFLKKLRDELEKPARQVESRQIGSVTGSVAR